MRTEKIEGKKWIHSPACKLVATVLTLVWAIAGVWGAEEGCEHKSSGAPRRKQLGADAGAGCSNGREAPRQRSDERGRRLTRAHVSGDMLGPGEGGLADGALVVSGHCVVYGVDGCVGDGENDEDGGGCCVCVGSWSGESKWPAGRSEVRPVPQPWEP